MTDIIKIDKIKEGRSDLQRAAEGATGGLEGFGSVVAALRAGTEPHAGKMALARKVSGRWEEISYAGFWERVERFAAGLSSLSVGAGSRVALVSKNRPEWPIADLAIQSLGAATVPIYPTLEAAQISHILADSGSGVAIVEDEGLLEKVRESRAGLPDLGHVIVMDSPGDGIVGSFWEVEEAGARSPLAGWREGWQVLVREDVATVIYTSGTTGPPKGVVLTHGNFLANLEGILGALPVSPEDTFLSFLPLSHIFERTGGQYMPLAVGASIYYAESVQQVPENLREVRPTITLSVPRLYEKMYERAQGRVAEGPALRRKLFEQAIAAGRERYALEKAGRPVGRGLKARLALYDRLVFRMVREAVGGRLRYFVSGGARLEEEIGEFFYAAGVPIVEGYGLTETSPVISCNRLGSLRFGTVGKPLHNVEVKISDEGEVLTRGPHVMRGYWADEEATEEVFTGDGWYRTGDMGEFDEDGYLKITDRIKNLIVLSTGKNVAPQPIETALVAAPHISQAILLGDGKKYVSALVVPNYEAVRNTLGTDTPHEELARDVRCKRLIEEDVEAASQIFADYERPKKISLLPRELTHEAGELTPTLKVKLRVVKERYADRVGELYSL